MGDDHPVAPLRSTLATWSRPFAPPNVVWKPVAFLLQSTFFCGIAVGRAKASTLVLPLPTAGSLLPTLEQQFTEPDVDIQVCPVFPSPGNPPRSGLGWAAPHLSFNSRP
ncbi:hypothetical protein NMY22_g3075 [Coprinellus aureogranulatus]|nr:hypothetical protein NMY22_g3075 [Coprinellus aureogranulatus]